jgi:aspartyl protease family protein
VLEESESMKKRAALALIGLWLAAMQASVAASAVEVEALLGDTAVLLIDGQRKTLRVGQSFAGVTLLAAQPTTATVEVDGRAQTVGLSQRVSTSFQERQAQVVTIPLDATMQYQTNATINGRSVLVMVDTGATSVAISSQQARSMNIDYSAGTPTQVETASGLTNAYAVNLQSVSVGGIQVENVPAMVVEGTYPTTVLLGMSYLRHVKLQEHNGILSLSRGH